MSIKRKVEDWSIEKLYAHRAQIAFPDYQREPRLWTVRQKALLIDSVLRDIDIPKLYFNRTADAELEVVDGQQRLWAIWDFIDGGFALEGEAGRKVYSRLSQADQDAIRNYLLQVTVFKDAKEEYLRELFLRLQLGLLLQTGEKLNAATGMMKDFVFKKMAKHEFVEALGIPARRFAKETLCTQICANSFARATSQGFARTRYDDLIQFFRQYSDPKGDELALFQAQTKAILNTIEGLRDCFGSRGRDLKNRSYILSVYLYFEEHKAAGRTEKKLFVDLVLALWKRLKEESKQGMDRSNRDLYAFETALSSAPGEKYQIEARHLWLSHFFEYYKKTGRIKGD